MDDRFTAAGEAGFTGPIEPPARHPEWQGSVSDKWLDRSGHRHMRKMVDTACRDGVASVARLGIGGYAQDASGLPWTEGRTVLNGVSGPAPTASEELSWRPSRRIVVPPHIVHREQLENTKLTYKPPFVGRTSVGLPKGMHPQMLLKRQQSFGHLGLDRDIRRIPFWIKRDAAEPAWWDAGALQEPLARRPGQVFGNTRIKEEIRDMTDYWDSRVMIEKGCKFVTPSTKVNHDSFVGSMKSSLSNPPPPVLMNTKSSSTPLPGVAPPRRLARSVSVGNTGPEELVRMLPEIPY
jgi:hypothetical protein